MLSRYTESIVSVTNLQKKYRFLQIRNCFDFVDKNYWAYNRGIFLRFRRSNGVNKSSGLVSRAPKSSHFSEKAKDL